MKKILISLVLGAVLLSGCGAGVSTSEASKGTTSGTVEGIEIGSKPILHNLYTTVSAKSRALKGEGAGVLNTSADILNQVILDYNIKVVDFKRSPVVEAGYFSSMDAEKLFYEFKKKKLRTDKSCQSSNISLNKVECFNWYTGRIETVELKNLECNSSYVALVDGEISPGVWFSEGSDGILRGEVEVNYEELVPYPFFSYTPAP